jgi:ACR3 family arsenite efflux pump ArsB
MEINSKMKIRLNVGLSDNKLVKRIKKEFRDDYLKLTYFYLAFYGIILGVVVYGIQYLVNGSIEFNDVRSEMVIGFGTLMSTMATMAKKLKDDIVSNYWKLKKMKTRQIKGKK